MDESRINAIMKKVHKLEVKARKLSRESFAGEFQSSLKGQGLDFEDFREYDHGDEVRNIDWNVTARMNTPYVRTFKEERELSMVVAVDISASNNYGSEELAKRELAAEICAVIAFCAKHTGNKIGLLLFTTETELYIPPSKGSKHTLRLIREVLAKRPKHQGTDINFASKYLTNIIKKKSLVFILSDFISEPFKKSLGGLARKHDLVAIRLFDPIEKALPNAGTLVFTDAETHEQVVVNTNSESIRKRYEAEFEMQTRSILRVFKQIGIDHFSTSTTEDYIPKLRQLLKERAKQK